MWELQSLTCANIWNNALCGYPIAKMEIKDSSQISTTAPIFLYYNYFRQNIWVNILVHFHFQYIFVDSTTNNIRFNSRPCSRCWCYPSLSPIKEKFHKCPISNQRIAGWEWKADLSVSLWNTIKELLSSYIQGLIAIINLHYNLRTMKM